MRYLFFLPHPAKFHFFRVAINELIRRNHEVDIIIITKDILEELVVQEGWNYNNIFPEGRKIKWLPPTLSVIINSIRTITRTLKLIQNQRYDLLIGDFLVFVGYFINSPSIFFTDDDIHISPHQIPLFIAYKWIVAPTICDIGKYNNKKISYDGYKALAHLHPRVFQPELQKLPIELQNGVPFFLLRLCEFSSVHDIGGKKGIDDNTLKMIIEYLSNYGKIVITAERKIPKEFVQYQSITNKFDISHYIYYSRIFIGDSLTMCTEAAVLGTPSIDFDDWWEECEQMTELIENYKLVYGVRTNDPEGLLNVIKQLVNKGNKLELEFQEKRKRLLDDKVDVSTFQIWLIENYPESVRILKNNPQYQYEIAKQE